MLDLFLDQRERFAVQPLARDLRALRPLRAPAGAPSIDLLAEIRRRLTDSLDYLAVRAAPCGPERCDVLLLGTRGGKPVEGLVRRRDSRIHYSFVGDDLLSTGTPSPYEALDADALARHARLRARCLGASPEAPSTWCDEHEWRRVASYTRRPDSVVQIAHLYDSPRAGTVNLFPRDGVGYNSRVPGRHAGESFHEKNAFVALWGEPVAPGGFRERSIVNGSVPVAIYQWLEGSAPRRGHEGWGFDPLPGLLGDGS